MFNRNLLFLVLTAIFTTNCLAQQQLQNRFSRADTLRGMLSPLRSCYDVTFYHLDIKVDIAEKQISGSNLFRFIAQNDFNKLQFDLFDNYLIEKIEYKGQELEYTTELDAVFIEFPAPIKKGQEEEFTVYYSGAPIIARNAPWDGGFIFSHDTNGKPWIAVACQGLGASSWWPNKDHQSDEPDSMMISVSVPGELTNVSNGKLRSVEKQADGYTKFNWFVSNPINNYNVTLNIGDYTHISDSFQGQKGLLSIDYFMLKANEKKAQAHLSKTVKPMLNCFESWFGPYPFYQDGYKLVETPYLGMEHQSAIAYGNRFQNGYMGKDLSATGLGTDWDYIIVHESGHEWFGNNITAKDIADMWIHESFTTYSESLFVECMKGKEAAGLYIKGERNNIKNDSPIIGFYDVNHEGSGDMYFKGASLLHTVRTVISDDEKWREILKGLNSKFALKTVTTPDIVNYINITSGKNLKTIFDQYLRYASIPTLQIRQSVSGVDYRWLADVKNFDMPIRIKKKAGDWKWIYPTSSWKSMNGNEPIEVDTANFLVKTTYLKR